MKSSAEIFHLVKSLTKQEKSYFKKIAAAFIVEESSNYLKYFDELVLQASKYSEYDEEKIKTGSYTGKFLKNLSFHKNYLYNMILSALVQYHKENKDTIVLRNLISQSEILFDKLLYSQSLKVLLRAKKLATETDKHLYLYEILSRERLIYKYTLNNEEFADKGKSVFKEQFELMDILKNNVDYYFLNDSFGYFLSKFGTGLTRNEKETAELKEFFSNPLLKDISNAKTFFNKTLFNTMNQQYQNIKNDFEKGYGYILENEKLWEDNLHKTGGKLDNYIFALNNLLNSQVRTKRFDDFEKTYFKMKNLEKKYPKNLSVINKAFIFYSLIILRISKCYEFLDTKGLEEVDAEVEKDLIKYEAGISLYQRIILFYFMGTSAFVRNDFEKSIYWMGRIINMEKTDLSQDYQCYSRIVYLISYFELGYFDSLEYALKSAYHFMSKRDRVYKYENIILKYLRISFRIKTMSELDEMFKNMKRELEEIKDDPLEQNAFDAFNILYWLDSKVKKIPMMELIKESKKIVNSQ